MKKKYLVLLTSNFPYGKGETFLESEIEYLADKFEKIIVYNCSKSREQTREVPKNVIIEKFEKGLNTKEKIYSFLSLGKSIVKNELKYIKNDLKASISFFKMKTLLFSLYHAKKINFSIDNLIFKHKIEKENTLFYSYWMDDVALALALRSDIKKICRTHRWDLYFEVNPENYLPFRPFILKNITCFSISDSGKQYLYKKTGNKNVRVSRLGTKKLNKNTTVNNERVIVSCSNVIEVKRVDLILESLSLCKTEKIKWVHIGDGPLLNKIKETAKNKKLNIEFKGALPNLEVLEYFQNSPVDLFINLSASEGIPVSIMEAFSCGIPTFATDVGGSAELVNLSNGFLLEANPKASLVAKEIDSFFDLEKKEILKKRDQAYNTWEKQYNAKKNYVEFTNIIGNL